MSEEPKAYNRPPNMVTMVNPKTGEHVDVPNKPTELLRYTLDGWQFKIWYDLVISDNDDDSSELE